MEECRVCLSTAALIADPVNLDSESEFSDGDMNLTFIELLNTCTALNAEPSDELPNVICVECCDDLQSVYKFIKKARKSDTILRSKAAECHEEVEFLIEEDLASVEEETKDDLVLEIDIEKEEFIVKQESGEEYVCNYSENEEEDMPTESLELELEESNSFVTIERRQTRNPDSDKIIECDICGKKLLAVSLNRHKRRKHNLGATNSFLCSSCPKSFPEYSDLQTHLKTHDKNREPEFACTQCDKKFFTKTGLLNHIKVHGDIRPFACNMCDKTFRTKYNLDAHEFTHTREGGVPCLQCGKQFFHQRDLDLHMRFHTRDFPFKCHICNKRFPIKSNLTYHLKEHAGHRFECTVCGKEFDKFQNLNKHKSLHSMPSNNPCPFCGKIFALAVKLKRHIRRTHSKNGSIHIQDSHQIDIEEEEELADDIFMENCEIELDYEEAVQFV